MSSSLNKDKPMAGDTLEICVKGKYFTVLALSVKGQNIILSGRFIRVAIVHAEDWLETELEDPEECIKQLKGCHPDGLKADIFTFTQKLPASEPKYPYPVEWDSVAAIRLTNFTEWWETKLPQETRKNVRRAVKRGVVTKVQPLDEELIRGIVELNNESPMRQGKPYDHYGKTFLEVKKDQSSFLERSDFICAYCGQELIGFMKIVYCGKIGTILQFIIKNASYDKRPANALIAKAVEHCIHKGMSYLVYGMYVYGNKRESSLVEFKRRNGFEEILVPRFYVPLTVKGRIAMALKIHRDLVGILPERLSHFGLNIREKWYKLKFLVSRCSSMLERPRCNRQMERSIPPAGSNHVQSEKVTKHS
jgi:hypothetical protein